ncbi:hypothetical protein C480_10794 [Natrialba aegyptia DSM 13077]|uniref:Uncharacterized protein n=1 Tax=Natrialba aegyptia DSM 13077 TaxID=1227491 RepID=M0B3I2_9EURY|nr:hypothetical protein C480_10794 [Natrialba aegyptia DSM 13077]
MSSNIGTEWSSPSIEATVVFSLVSRSYRTRTTGRDGISSSPRDGSEWEHPIESCHLDTETAAAAGIVGVTGRFRSRPSRASQVAEIAD